MKHVIGVVFVMVTPLLLSADDMDEVSKELKALEGKWKAVAMEAGGKPLPKDGVPDFTFTVGADGKSTAKTPQREDQTTITVDPKKAPRTIDNRHETGAHKGKTQYGIYKLEGDRWTVCMSLPGGDRPTDFATKGTSHVVFVFERVKADK
jgi:uncharacterized protein (TIGR03067 family)